MNDVNICREQIWRKTSKKFRHFRNAGTQSNAHRQKPR